MSHHRFLGDFDFSEKKFTIADREIVKQVSYVLRMQPGDELILFSGNFDEAVCRIEKIDRSGIEVEVLKVYENQNEPKTSVILYCSILKKENFELVVQKATEIGVSRIVPLVCERTVKTGVKDTRLEKIIREATEQSGRGVVPELGNLIPFADGLSDAAKNDLNFIFDVSGLENPGKTDSGSKPETIGIFIGPEGGWTEKELGLAKENKLQIVTLGPLTFRAETAAIIASYLAVNRF